MHSCKYCPKSYQSQASLARHLQNHYIDNSEHVCPTCNTIFSRRDLLIRHMQIHRGSDRPSGTSRPSRRRCHTACQPCRVARVKCNGEQPCRTCMLNQRQCRYTTRSHRVSRVIAAEESPSTQNHGCDSASGLAEESQTSIAVPPRDFPMMPVDLPDATGSLPEATDDAPTFIDSTESGLVESQDINSLDGMDLLWSTGCAGDSVSWPWLHELLYLQGNPLDGWWTGNDTLVDLSGTSPLDGHSNLSEVDPATSTSSGLLNSVPPAPVAPSAAPVLTPPATGDSAFQGYDRTSDQRRVIDEMVTYATGSIMAGCEKSRVCYWLSMSLRVAETFGIRDWESQDTEPALVHMMGLYRQHFSPLWPLLPGTGYQPASLHPLLFLTLISIGAMYGCTQECCFGTMLHEELCKVLVTPLFDLEEVEENLLPVCQARLLTQVAALYFGQRRAFSYAQHLGAVIIAQARRMDLFSAHRACFNPAKPWDEEQMMAWLHLETRKRLAFGILRADVYASVLLNSRPLLSSEEIDLSLPAPDHIWNSSDEQTIREFLAHTRSQPSQAMTIPFCDLVRIALDRSEALLDMEPTKYELLLFGLQEPVWRFSHDPRLFHRLTGRQEKVKFSPSGRDSCGAIGEKTDRHSSATDTDQLGIVHRLMGDLRDDQSQLSEALRKWERSFTAVRTTNPFHSDRTSIMSSLLLYKISFLRLTAPVEELHTVAYALSEKRAIDPRKVQFLTDWARGPEARVATDFACQIWGILDHETRRPVPERAKHNLLAFSGLHHAAVALWVFAGSQDEEMDLVFPALSDGQPIPLSRKHSALLMKHVTSLYRRLAPVGWCSFAAAAERLSHHIFPATKRKVTGTAIYEN